jgi:hypothetical protein
VRQYLFAVLVIGALAAASAAPAWRTYETYSMPSPATVEPTPAPRLPSTPMLLIYEPARVVTPINPSPPPPSSQQPIRDAHYGLATVLTTGSRTAHAVAATAPGADLAVAS